MKNSGEKLSGFEVLFKIALFLFQPSWSEDEENLDLHVKGLEDLFDMFSWSGKQ